MIAEEQITWTTASEDLPLSDFILVQLHRSRENAIPIGVLAANAGVSRRQAEEALQELATSGKYPLVACDRGYYLGNADDVEAYTESLRRRLVTQYRRIRALRQVARRMRGVQLELFT
jgi:hypothetical protein